MTQVGISYISCLSYVGLKRHKALSSLRALFVSSRLIFEVRDLYQCTQLAIFNQVILIAEMKRDIEFSSSTHTGLTSDILRQIWSNSTTESKKMTVEFSRYYIHCSHRTIIPRKIKLNYRLCSNKCQKNVSLWIKFMKYDQTSLILQARGLRLMQFVQCVARYNSSRQNLFYILKLGAIGKFSLYYIFNFAQVRCFIFILSIV